MMSKFHEMMAKKRDMKPSEKHAKMGVLKDLKDSLSDAMSDKMASSPAGMKKVSVMSNSPEGLTAGLDKAKQITGQSDDQMMSEGGISMNTDPNETEHATYSGTPHDDGFMAPNPNEAYSTGMDMTDAAEGSPVNSEETKDVMYNEGGEAKAEDVTYSGEPHDDGFMHEDSDEAEHGASYAEGGKVESPLDEAAESADEEREQTVGDMGDEEEAHPEFKGLNIQEVEEKLQHLLRMKKQMEKQ